ncbi:MAG: hypothetical protein WC840_00035 [Candidatus Peribacteraceae bacterium]
MRSKSRSIGFVLIAGFLLTPQTGSAAGGAAALSVFIQNHILNQALIAFGGIVAAAVFYYAVRMIVNSQSESSYSELRNSFVHTFTGLVVIGCAAGIANAFYTMTPNPLILGITSVTDYILTGAAGVFTLMVTIAGIGMVTSQGDEGAFSKWRKVMIGNIIGTVIMLLAATIVNAVTSRNPFLVTSELAGISLFLLQIIGFVCVIALIVAGILLIVSIDESLRDRAKRIIIGTLIALALLIASYTLIATFV